MKGLGYLLILAGFILGIYLSVVVLLFGGISQIVNAYYREDIAIGILKIIFCEVGFLPGYILIGIGGAMINE